MTKKFKNKTLAWLDYRLPIFSVLREALVDHPTPRNLNYWWNFGSLAGITLVIMIVSGLLLSMHYVAHVDLAFDSVEHIMRDVNYGWLLRYIHSVGASMFFLIVYIHISRGLYYGSYKSPREVLWWLGIIIFFLMIIAAFLGYTLPWGQMSFWGATVITNLFSAIPLIGDNIVTWLWGGFSIHNPTLNRFYSLHFLIPFIIVGVVFLHIVALHKVGSNNPTGIDLTFKKEKIPFHPYYTAKDFFGYGVFFIIFGIFVFFLPNLLGHPENYIPADPFVTPEHIIPEWYFLPFYAILRAIPFKLLGVVAMLGSILILFVLPWLDTCKVRSCRFRPIYKQFYWIFIFNFIVLGWVGSKVPEGHYLIISRICTAYYFTHFLIILPVLGMFEKTLPVPLNIFKNPKAKKN